MHLSMIQTQKPAPISQGAFTQPCTEQHWNLLNVSQKSHSAGLPKSFLEWIRGKSLGLKDFGGGPGRSPTCDLRVRSALLYATELPGPAA